MAGQTHCCKFECAVTRSLSLSYSGGPPWPRPCWLTKWSIMARAMLRLHFKTWGGRYDPSVKPAVFWVSLLHSDSVLLSFRRPNGGFEMRSKLHELGIPSAHRLNESEWIPRATYETRYLRRTARQ